MFETPAEKPLPRRWRKSLAVLGTSLLVGCSAIPLMKRVVTHTPPAPTWEAIPPMEVKAESSGLAFNEKERSRVRGELLEQLEQLTAQERYTSARVLVWRHPEIALDLLQSSTTESIRPGTWQTLARAYDDLTAPQPGQLGRQPNGWSEVVRLRLAGDQAVTDYFQQRQTYVARLESGTSSAAGEKALLQSARGLSPLLQMDALSLSALQHLIEDRPQQAVETCQQAITLAQQHAPDRQAELLLFLSDAQRRSGQPELAVQSWQQSVLLGAELLKRPLPIADPNYWEQAAYHRPAHHRWPQGVEQQLLLSSGLHVQPDGNGNVSEAVAETAVWACIGRWRLERNEPDPALVAFKRAETNIADPTLQAELRLAQAEAMFRLEQIGAATAILVSLSKQDSPELATRALALLGSMKLQAGQTQVGYNLLQRAISSDLQWSGRAQAEADFGLACLLHEEEANGLKWLHAAQRRFEMQGDLDLLAKCLYNESEYFKAKKQKSQAEALTARLKQVEQQYTPASS